MRPGGEAKRIEPESHPRPVERATTGGGHGGSENKLHVVNISVDENGVKPGATDGRAGEASVIVRAAEVIAAVGADQLALVAGEPVRAGWAYLAVMVDGRFFGSLEAAQARRTIL
ncbi:MAG: hypothetical protein WBQ95_22090 [Terracidiphilus sp.]